MVAIGIFLADQKFRRGDEVVKDVLLLIEHAGPVPVFTKLRPAAQICHRKHPVVLKPDVAVSQKIWSQANIEAAIAGQKRRVAAIELQAFLVEDEHGYAGSVLGTEPELVDLVVRRIN